MMISSRPEELDVVAAVERLPPEMLAAIFQKGICKDCRPDSLFETTGLPSTLKVNLCFLLSVTQVCQLWRAVALQTPALWTGIDNLNADRMAAFLERSQSMSISLYVAGDPLNAHQYLTGAVFARLRRLDVDIFPSGGIPNHPAPLIEVLTITDEHSSSPISVNDPEALGIPNHPATSLKALATVNPLPSVRVPHLTHLYVVTGEPFSVIQRFLAHTPLLESLHWLYRGWRPIDFQGALEYPIPLPFLRSLRVMNTSLEDTPKILSAFNLSSNIHIRLDHLVGYQPAEFENLKLTFVRGFTHLSVAYSDSGLYLLAEGPTSGVWIQSSMRVASDAIYHALDLTSVRSLHASLSHHLFPGLLSVLPALTTLAIEEPKSRYFQSELFLPQMLAALSACFKQHAPSILCPALEILSIRSGGLREDAPETVELVDAVRLHGRPIRLIILDPVEAITENGRGSGNGAEGKEEPESPVLAAVGSVQPSYLPGGGLRRPARSPLWYELPARYWNLARDEQHGEECLPWDRIDDVESDEEYTHVADF